MLHLQYMGLLNTDRARAGPVQVFLQGKGTSARYVLDRLPPWIEALCAEASESVTALCYIPGVNLDLLSPEARAAYYQQLVMGRYRVRALSGDEAYRWVSEVFVP